MEMSQANKRKIEKAPLMLHKPLKWNSLRIANYVLSVQISSES